MNRGNMEPSKNLEPRFPQRERDTNQPTFRLWSRNRTGIVVYRLGRLAP